MNKCKFTAQKTIKGKKTWFAGIVHPGAFPESKGKKVSVNGMYRGCATDCVIRFRS